MTSSTGHRRRKRRSSSYVVAVAIGLLVLAGVVLYFVSSPGNRATESKPVILYVNQGNGAVNASNFGSLVSYGGSHGFNTLFFQVYRQGSLLFTTSQLSAFVNESHSDGLRIFFSLYITNSSQSLPNAIYQLGEDGISLDMSALPTASQQTFLANLAASYRGTTAVTTTDMASPLKPDLLVLETYGPALQQYIRHGTVASVGVFTTSSEQDYHSQFQYALQNSDGVMVFDYAGLLKRGY